MLTPYAPEPYVNFAEEAPRERMLAALKEVGQQLGRTYPLRIGGKKVETPKTIASINPANYKQIVGYAARASVEQADAAIGAAAEAFKTWSRVAPDVRARYLVKAAAIMRRRVYEFS